MISKNQILDRMCETWESEYNNVAESKTDIHSPGMTEAQRYVLRRRMEHLYDNVFYKLLGIDYEED